MHTAAAAVRRTNVLMTKQVPSWARIAGKRQTFWKPVEVMPHTSNPKQPTQR